MIIAQLSDLHIDEPDSQNALRLKTALASLAEVQPEPLLTLITGDLTQDGTPMQYQLLQDLLSCSGPCALIPGNHDDAKLVHRIFPEYSPPAGGMRCLTLNGLRLVLIDSSVTGRDHGEIGGDLLHQMSLVLDGDPQPTLLAMHHPPVSAQVPAMDDMGLHNSQMFQKWVDERLWIAGILAGHYHQGQFTIWGERCPVVVAPSVAYPLKIDFQTHKFQVENKPPAGFLHRWKSNRLSSHFFICNTSTVVS